MAFDGQVFEASGNSGSDASIYATTVTISGGSGTLTYSDIPGVEGSFDTTPTILVAGGSGDESLGAAGSTQATINAGSDGTAIVLLVVED